MIKRSRTFLTLLALPAFFVGCNDYDFTTPKPAFEVSPQFAGVDEGTTLQLEATSGDNPVQVTWTSDDQTIASVSATGLVTGVKPGGPVGIIATGADGFTASSSITVNKLQGTSIAKGAVIPLAGAEGTEVLYRIFVPAGSTQLKVTVSGGTGDIDLLIKRGTPPKSDFSDFTCAAAAAGNEEQCVINNPQSGTWYILIQYFDTSAGATLVATYTP
jgi:serine protease